MRPRRSGGFCVRRACGLRRRFGFNCGPAGAGDFATPGHEGGVTDRVSIAAPPERGILQPRMICQHRSHLFQLRPRRSGGFCVRRKNGIVTSVCRVSIAAPPERGILRPNAVKALATISQFQLRPRRSGGFCIEKLFPEPIAARLFQLRPRRSGGFCHNLNDLYRSPIDRVSIAAPPERGILLVSLRNASFAAQVSIAAPPERGILRSSWWP